MGGLFSSFGFIIKTQNAGDMINGFDPNKYDKEKTSREVGNTMLLGGISIILIGVLGFFTKEVLYNYIGYTQVGLVLLSIVIILYKLETKCRIDKK
ncbi:MAG: DUF3784 domain-containing protein [Sarcina sp.]